MKSQNKILSQLIEKQRGIKLLSSISSTLAWDQETYMPEQAIEWRSEQLAWLSGQQHQKETDQEIGSLLANLKDYHPINDREKSLLSLSQREYRQALAFPQEYVIEKTRHYSRSQAAWIKARQANDFASFEPFLEKTVDYARQDAEYLGYGKNPYDALLDLYEPQMTVDQLDTLFNPLGEYLADLVMRIGEKEPVKDDFLRLSCPVDRQEAMGREILTSMGYDFKRGRLDPSVHPFTIEMGPADIRITTRYDEFDFPTNLYSVIHEGGHALYEMGIDPELADTILGQGVSMGIHESQSRLWENLIGRSEPFCEGFLPVFQSYFPEVFNDINVKTLYKGINRVHPSLIRVESDEVTYSLHVILRYNLEKALLEGSLAVKDLPQAWREESKKLLGIEPQAVSDGVLQDVHWSQGAIGYFPTYALGNLYGAQFFDVMKRDIPNLSQLVGARDCTQPLKWLEEKIHSHGSTYSPGELCQMVTGSPLGIEAFKNYLEKKYSDIYGV